MKEIMHINPLVRYPEWQDIESHGAKMDAVSAKNPDRAEGQWMLWD